MTPRGRPNHLITYLLSRLQHFSTALRNGQPVGRQSRTMSVPLRAALFLRTNLASSERWTEHLSTITAALPRLAGFSSKFDNTAAA